MYRGGRFEICRRAWCGACYKAHPLDRFHICTPADEEGFEWLAKESDSLRFRQARDGDHLITPFQCDWCLFRLLTGNIPNPTRREDEFLMCLIRRANLDAFWGREPNTVSANRRNLDQLIRLWSSVITRDPPLPPLGPFPNQDIFGVSVAVGMLAKSLEPGRYKPYAQFETMRKLRSAFSNYYHASGQGYASLVTMGRESTRSSLSTCPTNSIWFERFSKGCLRRMGQEVRQDLAISIHVMLALMNLLENDWNRERGVAREALAFLGAFACIAYGGSFRGNEVFLTDLFGLSKYSKMNLTEEGAKYVIIPLLGRFKAEDGEHYHLTPLAYVTRSGISIGRWVERLVAVKEQHQQTHGPAFSDRHGNILSGAWVETGLLDRLHEIQSSDPDLIPQEVNVYEEFGISRSFRRGATTQARNRGVAESDIDAMNRWRTEEQAKGRKPRLKMQDHYSDIRQMVPTLLRFSAAL